MKEIQLTQNLVALVDDQDFEWVNSFKWRAHVPRKKNVSYAMAKYGGKTFYMHRLICASGGFQTDHINGNGLDNRRSNLRPCSASGNAKNKGMCRRNTSGVKGVNWSKRYQLWLARIFVDGREIYVGRFHDIDEAKRAYDAAALQHHGEFARTNEMIEAAEPTKAA